MVDYTIDEFEWDVAFFNRACGNKDYTKEDTLEDVCSGVLKQVNIIQEEVNELRHAAETLDEQELKDAVIDVLFTSIRLVSMLEDRYDVMAGCHAIAVNNSLKYTTDLKRARQWVQGLQDGGVKCHISAKDIPNGCGGASGYDIYYCVKNLNGKVMKWNGFPKVNLSVMDKE